MSRTCFALQIISLCVYTYTVQCRKYDLEAEAIKLYGEDVKNLLMRFRRSPEYMNILDDKVAELKEDFDDMVGQITFAYLAKMETKVNETIYEGVESKDPSRHLRRSEDSNDYPTTSTMSPIEKLDSHAPLQSTLTVAEKNFYKDLGFKFAGDAIHAMIEQAKITVYLDDSERKSTRMIDERRPVVTTTEHVKVHEVTTETHGDEVVTVPPVYHYKYRANNETKPKESKGKTTEVKTSTTKKQKGSVTISRRHGEYRYIAEQVDGQKGTSNEYWMKPDVQAYSKDLRRQEVYGNKKYKPGVYEQETRRLGEHENEINASKKPRGLWEIGTR